MRETWQSLLNFLGHSGLGRILGLLLFVTGLLQYRSFHRQLFGLWSYEFFFVVLSFTVLLLILMIWIRPSPLADVAVFCFGLAYCLNALEAVRSADNITDLILFGSAVPVVAILQWLSMVFLFAAVSGPISRKLDEKWNGLFMLVAAMVTLALVGEGDLRVRVAVAPVMEGFPSYSAQAWQRRYVKLNSEGFRDVEHALAPDPTQSRLLIVGDSFAFGWGIRRLEDRLGEQLAARLKVKTSRQWEVINASKPGLDTLDEIAYLSRTVKYKPDVVVLVYVFNDIDYLIPSIQPTSLRNPIVRAVWLNSYLFQELFIRGRIIYYRFQQSGPAKPTAVSGEMTDPEFAAYSDPVLLSRHLNDVAFFAEMARKAGATPLVVPFDMSFSMQPRSLSRYENFLAQGQAHAVPLCSLEHTWDGKRFRDLSVSSTDGHPNEGADALAADAIANCLTGLQVSNLSPAQTH